MHSFRPAPASRFFRVAVATILVVAYGLTGHAQQQPDLDSYLVSHRFMIRQLPDSSLTLEGSGIPELLGKRMKGKRLFIYGQGFNHNLQLNASIPSAFLAHFAANGLTYAFNEGARSWVVGENLFYKDPKVSAAAFFATLAPFDQQMYEHKRTYFREHHFEFRAVDFERPVFFHYALQLLAARLSAPERDLVVRLAPDLLDSAYLSFSAKRFVGFYKEQQQRFYRDSAAFRGALGTFYEDFRYLLADPEPSTYNDDRNLLMASQLLSQIQPIGPDDLYFLSIGIAHSRPGKRDGPAKSTARRLEESPELQGRIVVMNLYCEDCRADGGGDNRALGFVKGSLLNRFQRAATSEITLFDLSELGGEYDFIRKDYGDMLIFAKRQY